MRLDVEEQNGTEAGRVSELQVSPMGRRREETGAQEIRTRRAGAMNTDTTLTKTTC
jgi:hypothetical protein